MDLERIKSLIRLANNNPNENEANSAARRACKELAANDFSLLGGNGSSSNRQQRTQTRGNSNYNPFEEFFNQKTRGYTYRYWDEHDDWYESQKRTNQQSQSPPRQEQRFCRRCNKPINWDGFDNICAPCLREEEFFRKNKQKKAHNEKQKEREKKREPIFNPIKNEYIVWCRTCGEKNIISQYEMELLQFSMTYYYCKKCSNPK